MAEAEQLARPARFDPLTLLGHGSQRSVTPPLRRCSTAVWRPFTGRIAESPFQTKSTASAFR
jgi:hypothetical protein